MKKLILCLVMLVFVGCNTAESREDEVITTYIYAGEFITPPHVGKVKLYALYFKDTHFSDVYIKDLPMSEYTNYLNEKEAKIKYMQNKNK